MSSEEKWATLDKLQDIHQKVDGIIDLLRKSARESKYGLDVHLLYQMVVQETVNECVSILMADVSTGEIVYCSKPAEIMFGYNRLVGMNIDDLVPADLRERHKKHRRSFYEDPKQRTMGAGLALSGEHANGVTFPVEVVLYPVAVSGRKCVIALVTDMKDRKN